ncbi:MAG: aminotransferase class I/II-fold pyridoxal phosphate-dependent enzyme, partial [Candidatus Limnocylindrales bacterium]
ERLAGGLTTSGWTVLPSVTNFLLVRFASPAAAGDVAEALLRRGLVPRTFGAGHPLADHLRITVRSPEQDDRLIDAARTRTARGTTTAETDGTARADGEIAS